jgi:hypothetical protein
VLDTINVKETVEPVPLRLTVVVAGLSVGSTDPLGPVILDVTVTGPVKVFRLVRVIVVDPELGLAKVSVVGLAVSVKSGASIVTDSPMVMIIPGALEVLAAVPVNVRVSVPGVVALLPVALVTSVRV